MHVRFVPFKGTSTMKSIIHEASSLGKAIDQGWEKAGKPQEFTIRVLEEAERGFLGFTKRSAKVAIYFEEHVSKPQRGERSQRSNYQERDAERSAGPTKNRTRDSRDEHSRPERNERPERQRREQPRRDNRDNRENQERAEHTRAARDAAVTRNAEKAAYRAEHEFERTAESSSQAPRERTRQIQWAEPMNEFAKNWLRDAAKNLGVDDVGIDVMVDGMAMRITIDRRLLTDAERERKMLTSWSILLLAAIKRAYSVGLRGHKIQISQA
jgi:predicted RNA-binding protein Jag